MTLEEAYQITFQMSWKEDRSPTDVQRKAKELIYNVVIKPEYESEGLDVPDILSPYFNERKSSNDSIYV